MFQKRRPCSCRFALDVALLLLASVWQSQVVLRRALVDHKRAQAGAEVRMAAQLNLQAVFSTRGYMWRCAPMQPEGCC